MRQDPQHLTPDAWLGHLFSSKAAREGGVIRRKRRDIERYAGWDRFLALVSRRGFQLVSNGDQIVIFCNREPLRRIAVPDPCKGPDRSLARDRVSPAGAVQRAN